MENSAHRGHLRPQSSQARRVLTISRWSGFTGDEGLTRSDLLDAVELQLRRDGVPLITPDGGNFRTPYPYIFVDVDQQESSWAYTVRVELRQAYQLTTLEQWVFSSSWTRETLSLARSQSETRNGTR